MPKKTIASIILAGMLLIQSSFADEPIPTISVSGSSEAFVVPDQIQLRFAVESRGSLADATKDNAKRNGKVLDFLKSIGIKESAIQTVSLEIDPIMSEAARGKKQMAQNPFDDEPAAKAGDDLKPKGYLVRRKLSAVISPIESFEKVYTGLLENGVNQIDSIQFRSTKRKKTEFVTRIAAISDAKKKAEAMASELGATLQGVQTITDDARPARYYGGDPFGGGRSSNAVAAGQMKIEVGVTVVFRLGDTDFE